MVNVINIIVLRNEQNPNMELIYLLQLTVN
jgi:hypothetical protein